MPHTKSQIKNILYIEDDAGLARLLQRRMERFDYKVDVATTGEEGLELYKKGNYDILLIDNYLPGMNGIEILKNLSLGELDPPAIFLTSSGDERLALEALRSNAADYLVKDAGETYLELLPSVMAAAYTRVNLLKQNRLQEQTLRAYAEKLRESEQQLNQALVGSETGVWDWNIETGELFWSENLKVSLELPPGKKPSIEYWFSRIHRDDLPMVKKACEDHLRGRTPTYRAIFREKALASSGREWNWVLARGLAQTHEDGKAYRLLGTSLDFTTHKLLEEQLEREKNNAEAANKTKSEFLATMSHEIRTPMNAIIGLADILSRTNIDAKQKQILETMQASSANLLTLINDLLDISRIEANQIMFEKIPMDLYHLLVETASILKVNAEKKGLNLIIDCENLRGMHFLGDKLRISQIITNLVSNAIKFTDQGKISITSEYKKLQNDLYEVSIHVTDSGIGIAENKLKAVFEKFVQADQSITRRFGGTGLGLSISNNLAEHMGGKIKVNSVLNKGSTFTLSLPLQFVKSSMPSQDKEPSNKLSQNDTGSKVLLVEDYTPNVMVAGLLLTDMGYEYEVATNGLEAVEKVKANPNKFAIILMDIQMHAMDGFEATKIIRQMEATNKWPRHNIIGLTAHALAGDREKCISAGMDEYISKPINAHELEDKIKLLLTKVGKAS